MSIPNKGSRKIVVEDKAYRWVISPDSGYIVFVAEEEYGKGRRIEVYINSDINRYWSEFPKVEDLNINIIKPKEAAFIISQAIKKGWDPMEKASPMVFDLSEDFKLELRK